MIPRIRKILYTTDLSKNSAYAFRYAINSAQKHDAKIHILHVIEALPSAVEGLLTQFVGQEELWRIQQERKENMARRIRDRLRQFAEREMRDDPESLKKVVSIDVTIGNPAAEILRKTEEIDPDVVILGSHGRGVIAQTFLGSVAEQVLHRIRKPVYIIPLPEGETDITLGEI